MRTAGVDLAAESAGTALAVIEWGAGRVRLRELVLGVPDAAIVEAAASVDTLGIDCAFGWPDEFVAFVSDHAAGGRGAAVDGGMDWRRTLAYRETDRHVRRVTGRWPLSVSTDRLGLTAMRCAGLLGRLEGAGFMVDRSGQTGIAAEVYPGATLRRWGFDTKGYRTDATVRAALLGDLAEAAPWLDLREGAGLMRASSDAFDAVIAALAAGAASRGLCDPPPAEHHVRATREGWIMLPSGDLGALAPA